MMAYMEAGGDSVSGEMALDALPWYRAAVEGAYALIGAGVIAQLLQNQNKQDLTWVLVGGFAGISLEVTLIKFGCARHLQPAAESYNRYLRRDLGLEDAFPSGVPQAVSQTQH
jgi:hypothetical protein